jgi:hypothetical protein
LALSLFLKIGVIAWYGINQDYIASELCEQKEIADNECQGNCQLNKALQLTEKPQQQDDVPVLTELEFLTFVVPQGCNFGSTNAFKENPGDTYITIDYAAPLQRVFHPPSC